MAAKRKKEKLIDDGRVIANMNVDGMRDTFYRRHRRKRYDEFGETAEKPEPVDLTRNERRSIRRGVSLAMIAVLVLFAALLVAAALFVSNVWLA